MKNKKRNKIVNILVLVAISAILLNLAGVELMFGEDFTILSMSQVQFSTFDNILRDRTWLVTAVQSGGFQKLVGKLSVNPGDLSTDGNFNQKGFEMTARYLSDTCQYNIQARDNVLDYRVEKIPYIPFVNALQKIEECELKDGHPFKPIELDLNIYCYIPFIAGAYGEISSPLNIYESEIVLDVEGRAPITRTISNVGFTSANFDNIAHVSWVGSLSSGDVCPSRSDADVVGIWSEFDGWDTVNSFALSDYLNKKDEFIFFLDDCLDEIISCEKADVDLRRDRMRAALDTLLRFSDKDIVTRNGAISRVSGDNVLIDLKRPIQFPTFTIRIKADELGIFLPQPNPDIISLEKPRYTERSTGSINAVIRNNGETGSITITTSCERELVQTPTIRETFQGNSERTIYIPVSLSGSPGDGTCTVTAFSTDFPDKRDSDTVTGPIDPAGTCNPGDTACIDNSIYRCNTFGTGHTTFVERCDYICTLQGLDAVCIDRPDTTTTIPADENCDERCKFKSPLGTDWVEPICYFECTINSFIKGVFTITLTLIKFILVIALGYISGTISNRSLMEKVARKKRNIVPIFSILVGITISYLAWLII